MHCMPHTTHKPTSSRNFYNPTVYNAKVNQSPTTAAIHSISFGSKPIIAKGTECIPTYGAKKGAAVIAIFCFLSRTALYIKTMPTGNRYGKWAMFQLRSIATRNSKIQNPKITNDKMVRIAVGAIVINVLRQPPERQASMIQKREIINPACGFMETSIIPIGGGSVKPRATNQSILPYITLPASGGERINNATIYQDAPNLRNATTYTTHPHRARAAISNGYGSKTNGKSRGNNQGGEKYPHDPKGERPANIASTAGRKNANQSAPKTCGCNKRGYHAIAHVPMTNRIVVFKTNFQLMFLNIATTLLLNKFEQEKYSIEQSQ